MAGPHPLLVKVTAFLLVAILAVGVSACESSLSCSLNGECNQDKQYCECDAGWKGEHCDLLDIQPGSSEFGYHNNTEASWGGNTVYADGQWHLFVAQFANSCPLGDWGSNSQIIRATSDFPSGPFTYQETIISTFSHNPTIQTSTYDGAYYLYMIGDGEEPTDIDCTNKTDQDLLRNNNANFKTKSKTSMHATTQSFAKNNGDYFTTSIHVSRADSINGPWSRPSPVNFTNDATRNFCGGTNPSPHFEPDGSVYLAFNSNPCEGHSGEFVWFARASAWNEPFTLVSPEPVTSRNDTLHPVCVAGTDEDPFLWRDGRGFHILTHGMCPSGLRQAHLKYSEDGITWYTSPLQTYHYAVEYTDAPNHVFARVERPQLHFNFFDEATGFSTSPSLLYNGVCGTGGNKSDYECVFDQLTGMTWTIARPIGSP